MYLRESNRVSPEALDTYTTPQSTWSYSPISHSDARLQTLLSLDMQGHTVASEEVTVNPSGTKAVGMFKIDNGIDGYNPMLIWINSTDKSQAFRAIVGMLRLICTNGMVAGHAVYRSREIHRGNIHAKVERVARQASQAVNGEIESHQRRIEVYKNRLIDFKSAEASHCLVRAFDENIISTRQLAGVRREMLTPTHEEYNDGSCYGLYNCFTHVLRGQGSDGIGKTLKLTSLFDKATGN